MQWSENNLYHLMPNVLAVNKLGMHNKIHKAFSSRLSQVINLSTNEYKYSDSLCFLVLSWGFVLVDLTHIFYSCFTDTWLIIWVTQYQWGNSESYV